MTTGIDQTKLLAALATLPRERARALATLPDVLTRHGEGHATVTIRHADGSVELAASNDPRLPPGSSIPSDGVVAQVARTGGSVYLTDSSVQPAYRRGAGMAYTPELAVPSLRSD